MSVERVIQALRGAPEMPLERRLTTAGLTIEDVVTVLSEPASRQAFLEVSMAELLAELPAIIKQLAARAQQGNVDAIKAVTQLLGDKSPLAEDTPELAAMSDEALLRETEKALRDLVAVVGPQRARELVQEVENDAQKRTQEVEYRGPAPGEPGWVGDDRV